MHSSQRHSNLTSILYAAAVFLTLGAAPVLAQVDTVSCQIPEARRTDSEYFAQLQIEARTINGEACLALLSRDFEGFGARQNDLYRKFGVSAKATAMSAFTSNGIEDREVPFDDWIERISTSNFTSKSLPKFSVSSPLNAADPSLFFYFDNTSKRGRLKDRSDNTCSWSSETSCQALLDDFAVAVNDYKYSFATLTAADTVSKLTVLSSQWDDYLTNSRSQTLLDLGFTTFMERSHFKTGHLVGPPKRQWSLLKPNLVIEHANDAPAGDRDKLAVVIEWMGVNWWSDDSPVFGKPFGISLASIYADRPGFESVGHGVMIHIDNKYSLGWASRSGDNSFYFSLDLLKFVEDQKKQLERYKDRLRESFDLTQ